MGFKTHKTLFLYILMEILPLEFPYTPLKMKLLVNFLRNSRIIIVICKNYSLRIVETDLNREKAFISEIIVIKIIITCELHKYEYYK